MLHSEVEENGCGRWCTAHARDFTTEVAKNGYRNPYGAFPYPRMWSPSVKFVARWSCALDSLMVPGDVTSFLPAAGHLGMTLGGDVQPAQLAMPVGATGDHPGHDQ